MKNKKAAIIAVFTAVYTVIVSLGIACFLGALSISIGSYNPWKAYPYYMPFCVITGLVAFIIFLLAIVWNIAIVQKNDLQSRWWIIEFITPIVLLIPMLFVWDFVFGILRKMF